MRASAMVLCLGLLAGCRPPMGTLEGVVEVDGEPVTGGFVMLFPTDGNYRQASSVKIVAGRYRITDIVPGEKRVSLDSLTTGGGAAGSQRAVSFDQRSVLQTIVTSAERRTLDFRLTRTADPAAAGSR